MFPGCAPAIVEITARNGRGYEARVNHSKGTPENPTSCGEMEEKFRLIAASVSMSEHTLERVLQIVSRLEDLGSVRTLIELLSEARA